MNQAKFISYFEAINVLAKTLGEHPTDEEFWMWYFFGKKFGGIDAYASDGTEKIMMSSGGLTFPTHRNELGHSEYRLIDLTRNLKFWQFLPDEIDRFRPEHRYVTGQQLLRRWTGLLDSEFESKNRIEDYALRLDCERNQDDRPYLHNWFPAENRNWSPIEQGVFLLEDINAIEIYDHMKPNSNAESESKIEAVGIENGNAECLLKEETITNAQVKKIFYKLSNEQWRGAFGRDLRSLNVGQQGKPEYKISDIENWLMKKGHYTEAEIKSAKKEYSELPSETENLKESTRKTKSLGQNLSASIKRK